MNYGTIKFNDIANGSGVRTSLFVSGCTHHCKNCFNPETWDFNYGKLFSKEIEDEIIKSCAPDYVEGLSLLGGEPLETNNQRGLLPFLKRFKEHYPNKTIWCYSGYLYEQLSGLVDYRCRCEVTDQILDLIDVLVDGEFVQDLYDISLRFRGSSNQRLIDVKSTRKKGEIIFWSDDPLFETHKFDT